MTDLKEVSFTTYQKEEIGIIQKNKYGVRTWAGSYATKNVDVKMLIAFEKGYLILFADMAHWQELK